MLLKHFKFQNPDIFKKNWFITAVFVEYYRLDNYEEIFPHFNLEQWFSTFFFLTDPWKSEMIQTL
jgi:hypothetical protein